MIRITVVDDDREEVQELCKLLQFTSLELQEPYTIETFYSGSEFLAQYRKQYELLCLDIDMPEKDGMAVAEEIRRRDSKVLIMFITHMAQMAIRGYEVQAVDFVLKPVNKYALLLKMQRIRKSLSQRKEAFFLVPDDGGVRKISSRELYYVEVSGHYLYYHAKSGVYKQKSPLRQIEEELTSLSFRKCNNCYLVNLRHVNAVRKEEVQIGTEWLKISRSRKKAFLEELADYMEGGGR